MDKSEIRVKTKLLAKAALRPVFFKVLFVLALEFFTELVLSLVFAKIAGKFSVRGRSGLEIRIQLNADGFRNSWQSVFTPADAWRGGIPVKRGQTQAGENIRYFQWFADPDRLKTVLSYFAWVAFSSVFSFLMLNLSSEYILNQLNNMLADLNGQIQSGSVELRPDFSLLDAKGILVSAALIVMYFILSARFMLMPYLMADNLKLSPLKAVGMSWSIMHGHTFEYILLLLSFIGCFLATAVTAFIIGIYFGWFLALATTMFIIGIYFYPYFRLTIVIFSEYVRADKKLREATDLAVSENA